MERLKRFENFEQKDNKNMILEEWKLPTFQSTIKRKLSFLKSMDLDELDPPATHQMEIKELWRKIMKKMYSKEKAGMYIELVDNYDVHHLYNAFEMIKRIKNSLVNKKDIGYLLYVSSEDKFYYEKPLSLP